MVPITGIDHALVGVRDLEAARAAWTRLGFTLTPRGRHFGWGTGNYCIMFGSDYVELLGIVDPSQYVAHVEQHLERRGEGLMGLAWAAEDTAGVAAALGAGAEPPKSLSRLLELPEGDVEPRFELVHFRPETAPAVTSFVTRHLTPELLRRPAWLAHANGALAIEGVTVAVEDPAALAPAYARLFGEGALHATPSRLDVRIGPHTLRFLTPDRLRRRYPELAVPAVLPAPLVMTVRVGDLEVSAAYLRGQGVPTWPVQGERLVVPPDEATGVVLELAAG